MALARITDRAWFRLPFWCHPLGCIFMERHLLRNSKMETYRACATYDI